MREIKEQGQRDKEGVMLIELRLALAWPLMTRGGYLQDTHTAGGLFLIGKIISILLN